MIFLTSRLNLKVQISPLKIPCTSSVRYLRSNRQNNTLLTLELELLLERTFISLLCTNKVNLNSRYTKCMFCKRYTIYHVKCKLRIFIFKKCEI